MLWSMTCSEMSAEGKYYVGDNIGDIQNYFLANAGKWKYPQIKIIDKTDAPSIMLP